MERVSSDPKMFSGIVLSQSFDYHDNSEGLYN